ncbi:MAG: ATP synthase F1 subunit delta [Gemmatimonadota bacterium]
MSRTAVARNYAETLLELASREDAAEDYMAHLAEVAGLARTERMFRAFLETPTVAIDEKRSALRAAFGDRYPEPFVRFFLIMLEKGRQGLLTEIETAYHSLMDVRSGRLRVSVTLASQPDEELRKTLIANLSRVLASDVMAEFGEDENIIGGLIIRVGDRVMDGSVRRRLHTLRRSLLKQ